VFRPEDRHDEAERYELSPGDLVRIGPDTVRSVHNESEGDRSWLTCGAPPLGTVDDFGEYRVPDGEV